ncbi:MAG: hypothetical protein KF778_08370 [Rhodocyclaceae bacterium]|nr:hypothetical protein [Rhodocyclaceae bacterium]
MKEASWIRGKPNRFGRIAGKHRPDLFSRVDALARRTTFPAERQSVSPSHAPPGRARGCNQAASGKHGLPRMEHELQSAVLSCLTT